MSNLSSLAWAGLGLVLIAAGVPAVAETPSAAVEIYIVQARDSLSAVARRFDVGAVELEAANPQVARPHLKVGQVLVVPSRHIPPDGVHDGIVINLAALRLFHFRADGGVDSFPISVGREGKGTPVGTTAVVLKRKNPTWTVPASIRAEDPRLPQAVPPGPKNPLGQYALNLGWPGYAIHGTNAPSSIGKPVSHGCIRMYPEDIARLFAAVDVGTPVAVIDQAFALARGSDGHLYLQVFPGHDRARQIIARQALAASGADDPDLASLRTAVARVLQPGESADMAAVTAAVMRRDGLPIDISGK